MCPSDKHLDKVRRILRNPMLCENIRHWYQLQALCAQFLLYALMALFATAYRYYLTSMFVLLVRENVTDSCLHIQTALKPTREPLSYNRKPLNPNTPNPKTLKPSTPTS